MFVVTMVEVSSRSALYAPAANTPCTPMQIVGFIEHRLNCAAASIIVRPEEMMSSTNTGVRPSQRAMSGMEISTDRSPWRRFSRTIWGARQPAAIAPTHCSLSASGPMRRGRATFFVIHSRNQRCRVQRTRGNRVDRVQRDRGGADGGLSSPASRKCPTSCAQKVADVTASPGLKRLS